MWIVKPHAASRGKGIFLVSLVPHHASQIDNISEAPIDEYCVVSRYINNPLLINSLKFDLRIYVLVTSFDPLRVYVYDEGLARFASEAYNPNVGAKGHKYSYLTNYSINKKNDKFIYNTNAESDDQGNKWSLSALCKHLEQIGVDMGLLWSRIYDVIIKSLLSVEGHITSAIKKSVAYRTNCFEILGYDIIVDSDLKYCAPLTPPQALAARGQPLALAHVRHAARHAHQG